MPYYEWRGASDFRDSRHNRVIEPGDVVELEEKLAKTHAFVEVDAPSEESVSTDTDDAQAGADEPEYEDMSYDELRQLAADADTDAINGRSAKDDILAYFTE